MDVQALLAASADSAVGDEVGSGDSETPHWPLLTPLSQEGERCLVASRPECNLAVLRALLLGRLRNVFFLSTPLTCMIFQNKP